MTTMKGTNFRNYLRFKKCSIVLFFVLSTLKAMAQSGEVTVLNGVSVPGDFPFIDVSILKKTAPGKIFIANRGGTPYMMILENDGTPYFYKRLPLSTFDFKLQPTGTLTMWHSDYHTWIELDSNFNVIYEFRSPGFSLNNHEIQLLPNGNYLVIVTNKRSVDMSKLVVGGPANAIVIDNYLQELDRNQNVLFEWRSQDHFDVLDAVNEDLTSGLIDYVHMNAIAVDYDDHLLISSRHLSEITKINCQTGEIIWRLGGENNQFQFVNDDYGFSYQHDIRPVPGKPNQYTLFDNGKHRTPPFSRALEFKLDTLNWTATKVWEYRHDPDRYGGSKCNAQRLPNGNTLINWSTPYLPKATEVTPDGEIVYEMNFSNPASCYRTFRFEWENSVNIPYLIAESHANNVTLIFNKFGDKSVTEYRVYGGLNPNSDQMIANTSEPFIHLTELDNYQTYYFRVTAVDSNGVESDFSNEEELYVKFIERGENLILNGNFSNDSGYWQLDISDLAGAQGFVERGFYNVQIDKGGVQYFNVQLHQDNLPIIENSQYVLEFDAWSSELKFFNVRVRKSSEPFSDYSKIGAVYSTTEPKHYSYEFYMNNVSDYLAQIVFECGKSAADLMIDNVSLVLKKIETHIESPLDLPANYKLFANFPNPFNPQTSITFSIPKAKNIKILIYDNRGQVINKLLNKTMAAGEHVVKWDGKNSDGNFVSSGIYFYKLKTDDFVKTGRAVLIK